MTNSVHAITAMKSVRPDRHCPCWPIELPCWILSIVERSAFTCTSRGLARRSIPLSRSQEGSWHDEIELAQFGDSQLTTDDISRPE